MGFSSATDGNDVNGGIKVLQDNVLVGLFCFWGKYTDRPKRRGGSANHAGIKEEGFREALYFRQEWLRVIIVESGCRFVGRAV